MSAAVSIIGTRVVGYGAHNVTTGVHVVTACSLGMAVHAMLW
jgi:hypothetical protein